MSDASHIAIPIPRSKTAAIISAAIAALLLLTLITLISMPMKVAGGDCGTIVASSDTWKYDSSVDAANEYAKSRVRSSADLDDFANDLVSNMMADLNRGSAVYEQCEEKHSIRLIWISIVGVAALLTGVLAAYFRTVDRRRRRDTPPQPADPLDLI